MEKNYELAFLISPDLTETEVSEFFNKIESLIKGQVTKKQEPTRIKLCYPILKKKEAFICVLEFTTDDLGNLQNELKKEKNILRFLLIQKLKEKQRLAPRREISPKPEKVEIDKIEEKLEQVL